MDPEQVRAEMKAKREAIDRRLDLLQERTAESGGRFKRAAVSSALMLIPALFKWVKGRRARAGRN